MIWKVKFRIRNCRLSGLHLSPYLVLVGTREVLVDEERMGRGEAVSADPPGDDLHTFRPRCHQLHVLVVPQLHLGCAKQQLRGAQRAVKLFEEGAEHHRVEAAVEVPLPHADFDRGFDTGEDYGEACPRNL